MPTILIVDDSVSVRKALERILQNQDDLSVNPADSAEAALEILTDQDAPDLIIADVVMPGMDGFELCQVLKSDEHYSDIPVILISGIVNSSVTEQAHQVGALDVIKKPFNPTDLIPIIRDALSTHAPATTSEVSVSVAHVSGQSLDIASTDSDLGKAFTPFLEKPDIESVMLVSRAGECELSLGRELADTDALASYFKFFASAAGVMGDKLEAAPLNSVMLEYAGTCLLLQPVNENHTVVLALANMGVQSVARFLLKKQLPVIAEQLKAEAVSQG